MSTEANPANLPNSAMLGHVSSLEEVTNNFHYKDTSVTLHVGDQVFSVSKNLLIRRSPVFRQMFGLSQQDEQEAVVLHNDPAEFKAFLVYLHSELVDASLFDAPTRDNILQLLGIATVAHMYELTSAAEWAVQKALDLGTKCLITPRASITVLVKLLSTTSRWNRTEPYRIKSIALVRLAASVVTQSALAPVGSSDMVVNGDRIAAMIAMLEAIGEHETVCWVYYHVLVYYSTWKSASWLRTIDRHRLLCGYYELTRIGVSLMPPPGDITWVAQSVQMQDRVSQHELWPLFDSSRWAIPEVLSGGTAE